VKTIEISKRLKLPIDAVTQTFGIIARKGGGKTYLAGKLAEGMLDVKAQVIIVDPVGNWWGLRLAADGKRPGYNITVLGGFHGDVPLEPESGALIAELLVREKLPAVIDVSEFSQAGRKRFMAAFAIKLLELKKRDFTPLHLMLEEAQLFAPQKVESNEAGMVGAIQQIVRLGRNYGIGATLISQRPQSINKEVLNQVECLFVLQVIGAHERKAIKEWWTNNAIETESTIGDLPSLKVGEAMVWSPQWLGIFQKHKIGKKKTFDGSATPKMGSLQVHPRKLAKREIKSLKDSMAAVIDRIAENDPIKLKNKIQQLTKDLEKSGGRVTREADQKELEAAYQKGVKETHRPYKAINKSVDLIKGTAKKYYDAVNEFAETWGRIHLGGVIEVSLKSPMTGEKLIQIQPKKNRPKFVPPDQDAVKLPSGAIRMVRVLVTMHPRSVTRTQLGTLSGINPNSRTFGNYLKRIKEWNMVEPDGVDFLASPDALFLYGDLEPVPTDTENLLNFWKTKLPRGAAEMLTVLVGRAGASLTREELAGQISMSLTSGTFGNYIKRLVSNSLAVREDGCLRAADSFFL